jgi:putative effector of murein hydrolase LrgA (UPF0299 family)
MPIATAITVAIGLAILLVAGQFLLSILGIAIPVAIGGIVLLFVLDKVEGGTAFNQLAERISSWLRSLGGS